MNEAIIETIRKLMEVTTERGATIAEAATAAMKAKQLLAKYDLDLASVEKVADTTEAMDHRAVGESWRRVPTYWWEFNQELASGCDCRAVYDVANEELDGHSFRWTVSVIGRPNDVSLFFALQSRLWPLVESAALRASAASGRRGSRLRRYKSDFIRAAAEEIGRRLRSRMFTDAKQNRIHGALVVAKGHAIDEYQKEKGYVAKSSGSVNAWFCDRYTNMDHEAKEAGTKYGRRASLASGDVEHNAIAIAAR